MSYDWCMPFFEVTSSIHPIQKTKSRKKGLLRISLRIDNYVILRIALENGIVVKLLIILMFN